MLSHKLVTATNDEYINAVSVCELLNQIAALKLPLFFYKESFFLYKRAIRTVFIPS